METALMISYAHWFHESKLTSRHDPHYCHILHLSGECEKETDDHHNNTENQSTCPVLRQDIENLWACEGVQPLNESVI